MSSVKVLLFQKNINTDLTKDQKQNISKARADFLILPRFFPAPAKINSEIFDLEKKYLDRILEISEYHKGVVLGGSIFRKENGKVYESLPIVQDVNLVDYYNLRSGEEVYSLKPEKGEGDSIYILHGVRFAIVSGKDFELDGLFQHLSDESIELLFHSSDRNLEPNDFAIYKDDLIKVSEISKKYNLTIVRCEGTGFLEGKEKSGRSYYSSPTGIKWKLGESENKSEILKNLNISLSKKIPL